MCRCSRQVVVASRPSYRLLEVALEGPTLHFGMGAATSTSSTCRRHSDTRLVAGVFLRVAVEVCRRLGDLEG